MSAADGPAFLAFLPVLSGNGSVSWHFRLCRRTSPAKPDEAPEVIGEVDRQAALQKFLSKANADPLSPTTSRVWQDQGDAPLVEFADMIAVKSQDFCVSGSRPGHRPRPRWLPT